MRGRGQHKNLFGRGAAEKEGTGMFEMKTPLRRLAAGVGAFALVAAGLLGTGTASADESTPRTTEPTLSLGNIVGDKGNLIVHKHKGDPTRPGTGHNGTELEEALPDPLLGVEFTVQRVSHSGSPIDLLTNAGWDAAGQATPGTVGTAPYSLGAGVVKTTGADGIATFSDLAYGLYLVTETKPGANPIVSPVAPFLVSIPFPAASEWLYDVHVYPKNKLNETVPTKKVEDPGKVLALGDELVWTVTAPIPPLATGDVFDDFSVSDKFDDRLSVDTAKVTVKLDGTTLVAGTDYTISPAAGTAVAGADVVVTLTGALSTLTLPPRKEALVVEYTSTVIELDETGYYENQAFVNTNNTEKGTNKPRVNYGSIEITKVNAADETQTLDGAEFELYDAKGGNRVGTLTYITVDGKVRIEGLWVGLDTDVTETYWVKETKAPTGYVTPEGDKAWTEVTVNAGGLTAVEKTIENTKRQGPLLPLTGGAGTAVFGGAGLLLVLGAVVGTSALRRRQTTN